MNFSEYKNRGKDFLVKINGNAFTSFHETREYLITSEHTQDIIRVYEKWFSDATSMTVFTSGSTSEPKLIHLQKEYVFNSAIKSINYFGLNNSSEILHLLPANKIGGIMLIVRSILAGANINFYTPSMDALQNVPDSNYNFCSLTPSQLLKIIDNSQSLLKLRKIQNILLGGAPVNSQIRKFVLQEKNNYYLSYGMTETISHIAIQRLNGPDRSDFFKPLEKINLDTDHEGRLIIYAPDLLLEKLLTNDLVKLNPDGDFKWLGRYDHVINSGGIKLIPELIEKKIRHIVPFEFYLVGEKDSLLGKRLVMLIKTKKNEALENTLKEKMTQILGKFEIPKEIYFKSRFSYTKNKKLKRLSPSQLTD